jgi:tetratricopeptide (TPR) repeat protein/tRNA A-37 threonylcarbamoyl transferase component Bud32
MALERFDRYVVEELVGEGGMGRVYRAYDERLDRTVALKLMRPDALQAQGGDAQAAGPWLVREARLAAQLEHPNVVAVYDAGEHDGVPFIAMEYVRGRRLGVFIGDVTVALERRLRWLLGIARALAAAHRRGLVHRDIKPGNVIVRDEDDVAKVLDFGIARSIARPAAVAGDLPTLTGQFVGTPQYMAPEQLCGEAVDGRADQFAWGVVAYALLTGTMPWRGEDTPSQAMAVLTQHAEPFAARVEGLDVAVEEAVLRSLSKAPSDRFAQTDDLVSVLEDALRRASRTPHASDSPPGESTASKRSRLASPDAPTKAETSIEMPRVRKPRGGVRRFALAAATMGLAAGLIVGFRMRATSTRALPGAPVSTPDAPIRVAVTDLPMPRSANHLALAAYGMAMQAYRDGVITAAIASFERALSMDPDMAAAHLRLSMFMRLESTARARDHFAKAVALRSSLDPHDQDLLQGLAPLVQRDPADYVEAERRLREASTRFPGDAELAFWLAVATKRTVPREAPELFDPVLGLDPAFGLAHFGKIEALLRPGRFDDALQAVDACLKAVPSSSECVWARAVVERQRGDCDALERDARDIIAMDDTNWHAWDVLAEGVYARTSSTDAVAEVLDQERARDSDKDLATVRHAFSLAAVVGDFAAAERAVREQLRIVASDSSRTAHSGPARALVELLVEQGRDVDAAAFAADFLRRREGWEPDPRAEDFAVARDPAPAMLAAELHSRKIDPGTFVRERDGWAAFWRGRVAPSYQPFIWAHGWAATAETPEDAASALDALAQWGGSPPRFADRTHLTADIGRTYALAGQLDSALEWLHAAAASCTAIEQPLAHVRSHYWLGRVLEQGGNRDGACESYRYVLSRWGGSRDPSVTVADTRARVKKLQCTD